LIRLAVRCGPDVAELVLAELLVLAPGGVEEEQGPDWVEYAIYGAPGELPELGSVDALAGDERIEVTSEEIPDDWADRWRDFHKPVLIADRVLVRPSWLEAPETVDVEVVIDPGQAFGTGAHPTTGMCIELLASLADQGRASGKLSDLGTGSGVLAIAAAKLGWDPVIAIDNELAALEAAGENAKANGVELQLERLNLRESWPVVADAMVANLTAPLHLECASELGSVEWQPADLICSGILTSQGPDVEAAFAGAGLAVAERRESGEWIALRLEPA
jgi:ribosomal protein L11 methyltransferase